MLIIYMIYAKKRKWRKIINYVWFWNTEIDIYSISSFMSICGFSMDDR